MSYLVADMMVDKPVQYFTISANKRLHVAKISLWVFLNNMGAADTASFTLVNDDTGDIVATKTLTGAQIKTLLAVSDNYSHGKLLLEFTTDILIGRGHYYVRCEQLTGFTASTFISWCRDWESPYNDMYGLNTGDYSDPYFLRLYNREDESLI